MTLPWSELVMNFCRNLDWSDDVTPGCDVVTVVSQLPSLLSRDMSDVQGYYVSVSQFDFVF